MKNGKRLTVAQKKLLKANGYDHERYLVVKNLPDYIQVVHKTTEELVTIVKGE